MDKAVAMTWATGVLAKLLVLDLVLTYLPAALGANLVVSGSVPRGKRAQSGYSKDIRDWPSTPVDPLLLSLPGVILLLPPFLHPPPCPAHLTAVSMTLFVLRDLLTLLQDIFLSSSQLRLSPIIQPLCQGKCWDPSERSAVVGVLSHPGTWVTLPPFKSFADLLL